MTKSLFGIDLGTQGARVLAVSPPGEVIAAAHQPLAPAAQDLPAGWFEQDPRDWWRAVCACPAPGNCRLPAGTRVAGICVDSTSGTILPVDAQGEPLHHAVMYNDRRSEAAGAACAGCRGGPPGEAWLQLWLLLRAAKDPLVSRSAPGHLCAHCLLPACRRFYRWAASAVIFPAATAATP